MWLSAISNRTPQAYFAFTLVSAVLLALAAWPGAPLPHDLPGIAAAVVPPLAVLIYAMLAIRMLVIADVLPRNTLWPGQAYLLAMLLFLPGIAWVDAVVHGLAGILVFYQMVTLAYNQDARKHSFNTALFIGAAALYDGWVLLLAPFALLGLRQLNPLRPREYLLFALGLALPYYFAWSYCFLTGDYTFWKGLLPADDWFGLPGAAGWSFWLRWAIAALLAGMVSVYLLGRFNGLPVRLRRLSSAMFYVLAGTLLAAWAGSFPAGSLFYAAPALAMLAALAMLRYANKYALEIIHLIFTAGILGVLLAGTG